MTSKGNEESITRRLRREARRYNDQDRNSLALDCLNCVERSLCGGMHRKRGGLSCLDDCCNSPAHCDLVCPKQSKAFTEYYREINGFAFDDVCRTAPSPIGALPEYLPMIYHANRRSEPLSIGAAAIPLHRLYSRRDGDLLYSSRAAIAAAFGVTEETELVAIGSGRDRPIEGWWGLSQRRREVIRKLQELGIAAVTSPNYSLFTDVPRHNDLANIKRILIAWQEFPDAGLPAALHVNARTEHDYERLTRLIQSRAEICDLSFEFGTGAARLIRRAFHQQELAKLAAQVSRPLHLIMIGGIQSLPRLARAFARITYIDSSAFMKALNRQRVVQGNDHRLLYSLQRTAPGAPVDEILSANTDVMSRHIERILSVSRLRTTQSGNVLRPESPERAISARAVQTSNQVAGRKS